MVHLNATCIRVFLSALLAFAIIAAPISAEAIHVEEFSDAHCEFCLDDADHADHPGDEQKHHQEHHAHGCGACHVHADANKLGAEIVGVSDNPTRFAWLTIGPPSADLPGLFRPPRS